MGKMEKLKDIPQDYLRMFLVCFDMLKGCVIFFDGEIPFWQKHWRQFIVIPCFLMFFASIAVHLINLIGQDFKFELLTLAVAFFTVCTQGCAITAIIAFKKKQIEAVIVKLGRMWRVNQLSEVQIKKKNLLLSRLKFSYTALYVMIILGTAQYLLAPIVEKVFRTYVLQQECELKLPFPCSFPFDPFGSWPVYVGVYLFEVFSISIVFYNYLGIEFIMLSLFSHLATEFTLLREDLIRTTPVSDNATVEDFEGIKCIVIRHQQLLTIARQLDDIFNVMTFVNLSAVNITICFFAFNAVVATTVIEKAINFGAVLNLSVPIFNECYYGELLREESSGLADAAYQNKWYEGGTKYKKYIWLIIIRSQKASVITSLGFSAITLEMFTTVMSTTWSYFSLALNLYNDRS